MVEIVPEPAVGVGMAGSAGTEIMYCRSSMAFLAVAVSAVIESIHFPILGVRMAADAGAAVIVTVGRFSLVTGDALTDLLVGVADLIPIFAVFMTLNALQRVNIVQIAFSELRKGRVGFMARETFNHTAVGKINLFPVLCIFMAQAALARIAVM